jgi:hypothetical protein
MKNLKFTPFFLLAIAGLALIISTPLLVLGSQLVQAAETEIIYKPLVTTAPIRRVGAGTRGLCKQVSGIDHTFSLQALAPVTMGQTASAQPILYWWIAKPVVGQFIFTVTADSQGFTDPVLDTKTTLSVLAGLQALPLAKYKTSLKPNVSYKWSVSLECDATNPSMNLVTSGMVKYVVPAVAVDKTKLEKLPYLYAVRGYWYDSLSSLAELIQKNPSEKKWQEVLVSLLRQGGLNKIAVSEKR